MWSTFIPVAIAGAIVASLVNVASELNKVRSSHLALEREAGLVQQSTQLKKHTMLIKKSVAAPLNAQVLILTRFALGPAGPVQFRS